MVGENRGKAGELFGRWGMVGKVPGKVWNGAETMTEVGGAIAEGGG